MAASRTNRAHPFELNSKTKQPLQLQKASFRVQQKQDFINNKRYIKETGRLEERNEQIKSNLNMEKVLFGYTAVKLWNINDLTHLPPSSSILSSSLFSSQASFAFNLI